MWMGFKHGSVHRYGIATVLRLVGRLIARNRFNHTSGETAVTPTDRPKSVRNRCVIEVFDGVFVLSRCFLEFSVSVGALVIGLGQISSFFFLLLYKHVTPLSTSRYSAALSLKSSAFPLTLRNEFHRSSQNNCVEDLFGNKKHGQRILNSIKCFKLSLYWWWQRCRIELFFLGSFIYCAYSRSFKINRAILKTAIDKTQSKHI